MWRALLAWARSLFYQSRMTAGIQSSRKALETPRSKDVEKCRLLRVAGDHLGVESDSRGREPSLQSRAALGSIYNAVDC